MQDICHSVSCLPGGLILKIAIALFFAILFLQSGLDKAGDWKGNLDWMKPHFAKSPVKNQVPFFMGVIMVLELGSGLCAGVSAILMPFRIPAPWFSFAMIGAAGTLLMLFSGQRIAKDYAGAAALVSYFIVALVGLMVGGGVV